MRVRLCGAFAAACMAALAAAATAAAATAAAGECTTGECSPAPSCPANCSLSQCPCYGPQRDGSNYTRPMGCVAHVRTWLVSHALWYLPRPAQAMRRRCATNAAARSDCPTSTAARKVNLVAFIADADPLGWRRHCGVWSCLLRVTCTSPALRGACSMKTVFGVIFASRRVQSADCGQHGEAATGCSSLMSMQSARHPIHC